MGKFQTLPSNILLIVLFLFQLNLNAQDFIPKPIINHQLAGYFKLENHLYLNNHCKGKDFGTVVTNFIENIEPFASQWKYSESYIKDKLKDKWGLL
jgi:hypothetical protein